MTQISEDIKNTREREYQQLPFVQIECRRSAFSDKSQVVWSPSTTVEKLSLGRLCTQLLRDR